MKSPPLPPTFREDVYYRDSTFASFFSWIPWFVHKLIVLSGPAILAAIYFFAGPIVAAVMAGGAIIYTYDNLLFPKSINEFFMPRKLRTKNMEGKVEKVSKNIAVIGAGPCGIGTLKELAEAGHKVSCYDMNDRVGGTFYASFWPEGRLVSSPYVTCFSDYECKRHPNGKEHWDHHTAIEYVEYVEQYIDHFKLNDSIHLKHKILHLSRDENKKYWLKVQNLEAKKDAVKVEGPFDHIALCSGAFNTKHLPKIPGLESFDGIIRHTRDFAALPGTTLEEAFKDVAGKRVVAVGLGESLADILALISVKSKTPVKDAYVAIRNGATVFPRTEGGNIVDMRTNRLRHSLPKFVRTGVHMFMLTMKALFGMRLPLKFRVQYFMLRSLKRQKPGYCKSTKSDNFVRAIDAGKLKVKVSIDRIEGKTVYFKDGSMIEDVDVIIYGTGFAKPEFSFIDEKSFPEEENKDMATEKTPMKKDMGCGEPIAVCPTARYLRMFDPKFGAELGFIGVGVRPLVGAIPPIAEHQARLFAMICSGERQLPDNANMMKRIKRDRKHDEYEFSTDNEQWQGLVNFLPYMDLICGEIGCMPSRSWLLTRPKLARKLMLGGPIGQVYRLRGPGATPEMAEDIIMRSPIETPFNLTLALTGAQFTTALFYWPVTFLRMGRDALDQVVNVVS